MAPILIGQYLFHRLKQLGVQTVFGVPGDYELALLDLVDDAGVKFSGNPNELIASYAADGYARVAGVGAYIDTFGPGELSSYCGHAGAYAEFVPVAHIVGYPGRDSMKTGAIMHHSLGNGRFDMFHEMAKHISATTSILLDTATATAEIDRCLQTMLTEGQPVYIGIPVDVSHLPCDSAGLEKPLQVALPPNNAGEEASIVAALRDVLEKSQYPVIVVDGLAVRSDFVAESRELSKLTGLPTFATCMGKSGADEVASNFGGIYAGAGSLPAVQQAVEKSDAAFWLGNYPSDFNTGEFTTKVAPGAFIDLQRTTISFNGQKHSLSSKYVLQSLNKSLREKPLSRAVQTVSWSPWDATAEATPQLTQDQMWPALGKFFKDGDFVIAETGTSSYGITAAKFPSGAFGYNQTVFGSIGFATGAAVGSFQAIKERGNYKRSILVTGEGSMHLTIQAYMDLLKLELNPIIFVLNNDGYTIERLIHGKEASYNALPVLDYSTIAHTFGPDSKHSYHGPVKSLDELNKLFASGALDEQGLKLVELKLHYLDAPGFLKKLGAFIDEFNAKKEPAGGKVLLDTGRSVESAT